MALACSVPTCCHCCVCAPVRVDPSRSPLSAHYWPYLSSIKKLIFSANILKQNMKFKNWIKTSLKSEVKLGSSQPKKRGLIVCEINVIEKHWLATVCSTLRWAWQHMNEEQDGSSQTSSLPVFCQYEDASCGKWWELQLPFDSRRSFNHLSRTQLSIAVCA